MLTPTSLPLPCVRFTGGRWRERIELIGRVTLPRQWQARNDAIPDLRVEWGGWNLQINANHPWDSPVNIEIGSAPEHACELAWRVSGSAPGAEWTLNDEPIEVAPRCGYLREQRRWQAGDVFKAQFNPALSGRTLRVVGQPRWR